MSEIPRSLRYMYLQNKSIHYDKLESIKPIVDSSRSPNNFKRTTNADGFSMNQKSRNKAKKKIQGENQMIATRLLNLMQSTRRQVEVQGSYSKYNHGKRGFLSVKKDQIEKKRNISHQNSAIAQRIVNIKATIETAKKLSEHNKFIQDVKKLRRYNNDSKSKSVVEIYGPYVPKSFSSILNQEEKRQLEYNNKTYLTLDGLYRLPNVRRSRSKFNSSSTMQVDEERSSCNLE